jgi:hypothetical protein
MQRGLEETWRKIDRGEIRGDGRAAGPLGMEFGEKVTIDQNRPASSDMTIRQILDAMARALDRVAHRFADQKVGQTSEPPLNRPID